MCSAETDCVENARCLLAQERNKTIFAPGEKICVCEEGLPITPTGACGGKIILFVIDNFKCQESFTSLQQNKTTNYTKSPAG